MPFSYRKDIIDHKQKVSFNTLVFIQELYRRQALHDNDKVTNDIIFSAYDAHNNTLRQSDFGSEKYRSIMQNELAEAAFIHAQNRHHFYAKAHQQDTDVNIFDLIETIVDIKSSIERYDSDSEDDVCSQLKKAMERILEKQSLDCIVNNTIDYIFSKEGNIND